MDGQNKFMEKLLKFISPSDNNRYKQALKCYRTSYIGTLGVIILEEKMRTIKFRVWDEYTKKMIGPFSLGSGFCAQYGGSDLIMEYTGLKDVNDIEIYEGDILKCYYTLGDSKCVHIGIVKYDDLNTHFYSHSINNEISRSMSGINDKIERMGNIYENPELLTPNSV